MKIYKSQCSADVYVSEAVKAVNKIRIAYHLIAVFKRRISEVYDSEYASATSSKANIH